MRFFLNFLSFFVLLSSSSFAEVECPPVVDQPYCSTGADSDPGTIKWRVFKAIKHEEQLISCEEVPLSPEQAQSIANQECTVDYYGSTANEYRKVPCDESYKGIYRDLKIKFENCGTGNKFDQSKRMKEKNKKQRCQKDIAETWWRIYSPELSKACPKEGEVWDQYLDSALASVGVKLDCQKSLYLGKKVQPEFKKFLAECQECPPEDRAALNVLQASEASLLPKALSYYQLLRSEKCSLDCDVDSKLQDFFNFAGKWLSELNNSSYLDLKNSDKVYSDPSLLQALDEKMKNEFSFIEKTEVSGKTVYQPRDKSLMSFSKCVLKQKQSVENSQKSPKTSKVTSTTTLNRSTASESPGSKEDLNPKGNKNH